MSGTCNTLLCDGRQSFPMGIVQGLKGIQKQEPNRTSETGKVSWWRESNWKPVLQHRRTTHSHTRSVCWCCSAQLVCPFYSLDFVVELVQCFKLSSTPPLLRTCLRPLHPPSAMSSSSELSTLMDLTGADERAAHFFLESSGFDLNAAASAYWEQQQHVAEQQQQQGSAVRASAVDSDGVRAPLPAVEDQLYDSQLTHTHTHTHTTEMHSHAVVHTRTGPATVCAKPLPNCSLHFPLSDPSSLCWRYSAPAVGRLGGLHGNFKLGEVHVDPFRSFRTEFATPPATAAAATRNSAAQLSSTAQHNTAQHSPAGQLTLPSSLD